MMIDCPECGRRVSDRAKACPDCGFPVAEEVAAARAAELDVKTKASRRVHDQEVDCPRCNARGFIMGGTGAFEWCSSCEHSGRLCLGQADDGYYGVAPFAKKEFLAATANPDDGTDRVFFLGAERPDGHRYEQGSQRVSAEDEARMAMTRVPIDRPQGGDDGSN